jgi:hypothetical protein
MGTFVFIIEDLLRKEGEKMKYVIIGNSAEVPEVTECIQQVYKNRGLQIRGAKTCAEL